MSGYRSNEFGTVGLPYAASATGKLSFEVEVESWIPAHSVVTIGFAGTNFCCAGTGFVGEDSTSWAVNHNGFKYHGWVFWSRNLHCLRLMYGCSGQCSATTLGKFMMAGTWVAVAVDLDAGSMCVSAGHRDDCSHNVVLFDIGVAPGKETGGGLYPVVSGMNGAKLRLHFGNHSISRSRKNEIPENFETQPQVREPKFSPRLNRRRKCCLKGSFAL